MFPVDQAQRLKMLPPYLFAEIDRMKEEVRASGVDIIDLGVGDPDLPTPTNIIEKLKEAAEDKANHRYPSYSGMVEFRASVARWYKRRFGVELVPAKQVCTLIGSKEGIAHLPLAFVNPGDAVLVPDPAYPVYKIGSMFAGGIPHAMPLLEKNGFLPDLEAIDPQVAKKAKLMFINYPNNPTAAVADLEFYERVVAFAQEHQIIVCADAAYSEMSFDGYKPVSFLQAPGALEVGIEFHSLSKTYNMTGWRLGWAAGREEVIQGLGRIKENIDSGAFQAVQMAGIEALEGDQAILGELSKIYAERRDTLAAGLRKMGLTVNTPQATFYLWVGVPQGYTSAEFTAKLLKETGIVCTPGNGLGVHGEGYIRFALTQNVGRLEEAVKRLGELKL